VVRIIAGSRGRRVIRTPAGQRTRPTSDRVRESLFGTLGRLADLPAGGFLDLYAGSGAVGLEAVSRGAAHAVFVERDPAVGALIRENIRTLDLGAVCRVEVGTVQGFLERGPGHGAGTGPQTSADAGTGIEAVFLDPPYELSVDEDLRALAAPGWIAPGGVCVVERSARTPAPVWPEGLTVELTRSYGDTVLIYARRG
jgi:16S rRNA (guanine966-N2)-methyltransferase